MPTEDFTALAGLPAYKEGSAFTHELKVLSERPTPTPAGAVGGRVEQQQQAPPGHIRGESPPAQGAHTRGESPPAQGAHTRSESPPAQDAHTTQHIDLQHLPPMTLHDVIAPLRQKEWNKTTNVIVDIGIATAALFAAEAIGAVVFKSPKLAEAAAETALASTSLGAAAAKTAFVLERAAVYGGAFGLGVGARHLAFRAISGHNESWSESAWQAGAGLTVVGIGKGKRALLRKIDAAP